MKPWATKFTMPSRPYSDIVASRVGKNLLANEVIKKYRVEARMPWFGVIGWNAGNFEGWQLSS